MKHNAGGYRNYGCRCAICTADHRDRKWRESLARRERTAANGGIAPVDPHGSVSTYNNWGCRCRPCTDAHVARHREWRMRARA